MIKAANRQKLGVRIGVGVDQHVGRAHHMFPNRLTLLRGQIHAVQRIGHELQPTLRSSDADGVIDVTHAQARVATLFLIILRAAPVLAEEHFQTPLGALKIIRRIHRPQNIVVGDLLIKTVDDEGKRFLAAHGIIKIFRGGHGYQSKPWPSASKVLPMRELALNMAGVTVRRGEKLLLDDISLSIPQGSHWAVLGPNGAGKTTLLKIAATLLYPSEGTVDILGHRFGRVDTRELRKTIGLVDPKQRFSNLPAHEIVLSGLTASNGLLPRWSASAAELERCDLMLELVGMTARADRFWADMSQGEKARTLIARALIISPALLLLDEPTTGLDLPGRETLLSVIDGLRASLPGLTTVMITHHVEEIAASTTDILMIKDARVLASGPVMDVMTPANLGALYDMSVSLETVRGRWFAFDALH